MWQGEVDSLERLVGMIAVGEAVISDLNDDMVLDTPHDISSYRLLANVSGDQINHAKNTLVPGMYGIWIKATAPGRYHLFTFGSDDFIGGMKDFCDLFNVDPQSYMSGFIFDYGGIKYLFEGNSLAYIQVTTEPTDLDDVEEEEKDNENIIEPLRKDY
jgi:hypothetical protein